MVEASMKTSACLWVEWGEMQDDSNADCTAIVQGGIFFLDDDSVLYATGQQEDTFTDQEPFS